MLNALGLRNSTSPQAAVEYDLSNLTANKSPTFQCEMPLRDEGTVLSCPLKCRESCHVTAV